MSNVSLFTSVNVLGAILVLGGYVITLMIFPEYRTALWGGVKGTTQSLFTISMLLAAAGYLVFIFAVLLKSNPNSANTEAFRLITCLSLIFLLASAIWMPATVAVSSLWITAAALISLVVLFLISDIGIESSKLKTASIIGLIYITFHCLVLDAIIWVFKFPVR